MQVYAGFGDVVHVGKLSVLNATSREILAQISRNNFTETTLTRASFVAWRSIRKSRLHKKAFLPRTQYSMAMNRSGRKKRECASVISTCSADKHNRVLPTLSAEFSIGLRIRCETCRKMMET